MDYRELLGLGETFTEDELKKAFRKEALAYHPDQNSDSCDANLKMIRLNQAYNFLAKHLHLERQLGKSEPAQPGDAAYEAYKSGCELLKKVHPSRWKKVGLEGLFSPASVESKGNESEILAESLGMIRRAYARFSTVVNQYRESCWYADSEAKLRELDRMTVRYQKMYTSYQNEARTEL